MPFVAGVDSSTQSTKVEIRDLETGHVAGRGAAAHPAVTPPVSEQDPGAWWAAFELAWEQATTQLPARSGAIVGLSVAAQQHGLVAVDEAGVAVHPAKLWNDTESAPDAGWLHAQLGGGVADWAEAVGSVPLAAFTVTKLSWLHRTHPEAWTRFARVSLPHDHLTWRLTGEHVTDRGDASGTGYWSPATGEYRWDLLAIIDDERDWSDVVPTVLGPRETAGAWNGIPVAAGTGDNMAAALGLGLAPGDAAISIGTSGTVFTVADAPTADPTGAVAGFADATGRFLPLVCTSNAAKVLDVTARLLGVEHGELDRLALAAAPGGPVLLPYLDGERTPNRPEASGVLAGIRSDVTREQFARAAVDGVACGLLDAFDELHSRAPVAGRVVLTGGGARSTAVAGTLAAALADMGRPCEAASVAEAVATGAAVQAAALVDGVDHAEIQHRWGLGIGTPIEAVAVDDLGEVRARYAAVRDGDADSIRQCGRGAGG